jgi:hypothetical protein
MIEDTYFSSRTKMKILSLMTTNVQKKSRHVDHNGIGKINQASSYSPTQSPV